MLQPPRPTSYARHNKALLQAAKAVAEETVTRAGEEIRASKPEFENGLVLFSLMELAEETLFFVEWLC